MFTVKIGSKRNYIEDGSLIITDDDDNTYEIIYKNFNPCALYDQSENKVFYHHIPDEWQFPLGDNYVPPYTAQRTEGEIIDMVSILFIRLVSRAFDDKILPEGT